MQRKIFKTNESYFKYLGKYKNAIDVIKVNLIMKEDKSEICLVYKKRKLAL